MNLQGSDRRLLIWIDIDGSAESGHPRPVPGSSEAAGADLEIEFSPRPASRGVAVWKVDHSGTRTRLRTTQVGLVHAPTYAATDFELRVLRRPDDEGQSRAAWEHVSGVISMSARGQDPPRILGTFHLPAPGPSAPQPPDEPIPARDDDAVRVVSYNVRHTSPLKNPGPFARIFTALEPDIVLIQEWRQGGAERLKAWFDEHVPRPRGWHVSPVTKRGDAIVSRHPIEPPTLNADGAVLSVNYRTTASRRKSIATIPSISMIPAPGSGTLTTSDTPLVW